MICLHSIGIFGDLVLFDVRLGMGACVLLRFWWFFGFVRGRGCQISGAECDWLALFVTLGFSASWGLGILGLGSNSGVGCW